MAQHSESLYAYNDRHEETRVQPSASFKSQLATWHANRGNKSFLSAMIPRGHVPVDGEEQVTKNPIKLLRMVDRKGWLFFLSGWFAWTCDGYDFFAVSLTVTRLAKQFGVDTKVSNQALAQLCPSIVLMEGNHNRYHPHTALPISWRVALRCSRRSIRQEVDLGLQLDPDRGV